MDTTTKTFAIVGNVILMDTISAESAEAAIKVYNEKVGHEGWGALEAWYDRGADLGLACEAETETRYYAKKNHAVIVGWRSDVDVDDDLCERWLGRDWPETTTPAEAMRLATACQAKRDAGDSRDYTVILAEVVAAS